MKRIKNRYKNEQGFTLVDVLISMTIIVLIGVVVIAVFFSQKATLEEENTGSVEQTVEVSPDFYPAEEK